MALGAALLILDAIGTKRHRYLDLAVVAIVVAGVAFDLLRTRRRRRSEFPQQTEDE
jgi:hypothetical protein